MPSSRHALGSSVSCLQSMNSLFCASHTFPRCMAPALRKGVPRGTSSTSNSALEGSGVAAVTTILYFLLHFAQLLTAPSPAVVLSDWQQTTRANSGWRKQNILGPILLPGMPKTGHVKVRDSDYTEREKGPEDHAKRRHGQNLKRVKLFQVRQLFSTSCVPKGLKDSPFQPQVSSVYTGRHRQISDNLGNLHP